MSAIARQPWNLFAPEFVTILKFFRDNIDSYVMQDGSQEKLRVAYGTPHAAFRRIFSDENVNGKPNLPYMNFWAMEFRRVRSHENPFVRYTIINPDGTVSIGRAPQWYEISLQFSLWTSSYKSRDDVLAQYLRFFPGQDIFLPYYPDPVNYPDIERIVQIELDESITDETELEGLEERETRDVVRTVWTGTIKNATLPYLSCDANLIESIQIEPSLKDEPGTESKTRYKVISSIGTDPDLIEFEITDAVF